MKNEQGKLARKDQNMLMIIFPFVQPILADKRLNTEHFHLNWACFYW